MPIKTNYHNLYQNHTIPTEIHPPTLCLAHCHPSRWRASYRFPLERRRILAAVLLGAHPPPKNSNTIIITITINAINSANSWEEMLIPFPILLPSHTQGVQLPQNSSTMKIVRTGQSLVIQKVSRSSSGSYQCGALNTEGETQSHEIRLKIKCK